MSTAASRAISRRTSAVIAGLLVLGGALAARAETPLAQPELAERAQLFIALLKRRAEAIVEARRAPPPPRWNLYAGATQGYESNVNLDGTRKGDRFTEESLTLVFRPTITSWLSGEATYDLLNTHYHELTDSNLWSNTASALLKLKPVRRLEVAAGWEYSILNFPLDSDSSFADQRTKATVSFAQTGWLTHLVGWTYQLREYDTRKARDFAGTQQPGANRQDQRHTGSYELRCRFPKLSARVGAEYYQNASNDQLQDFYDWQDLRLRAVLTRAFGPQWVGTLSASHERKNYEARSVPAIAVAERDDLVTVAGSLIYQLTPRTSVTGNVTYRHQDSNDPRLDFTDWISQVSVSIGF